MLFLLLVPVVLLIAAVVQRVLWHSSVRSFDWEKTLPGFCVDILADEASGQLYLLYTDKHIYDPLKPRADLHLQALTMEGKPLWLLQDAALRGGDFGPQLDLIGETLVVRGRQGSRLAISADGQVLWEVRSDRYEAPAVHLQDAQFLAGARDQLAGFSDAGELLWVRDYAELQILQLLDVKRRHDGSFALLAVCGERPGGSMLPDNVRGMPCGGWQLIVLDGKGGELARRSFDCRGICQMACFGNGAVAVYMTDDWRGGMYVVNQLMPFYSADPLITELQRVGIEEQLQWVRTATPLGNRLLLNGGSRWLEQNGRLGRTEQDCWWQQEELPDGSLLSAGFPQGPMLDRWLGSSPHSDLLEVKCSRSGRERVLLRCTEDVNLLDQALYTYGGGWLVRASWDQSQGHQSPGGIRLQGRRVK